ncbi:TetR/AcrR family transcriptional regulator [Sanguibacter sp. HDW7]|uniref:TetR/AcrR family transcriptional regulator n=1 Tax=Sanguibacter sp. HDW7 TaxID=2714931 RepID=UPI001408B2AF|nr:TetR/AcrR family transcriptional regulator [Sanguibacter sp. HDW7]QIK83981.1 helix-turn-helix transcriptional regulator [Sanguibacter sp. HDW7]
MPISRRPVNRGPAAAAANRAALVDAARRLFTERGYRVPLHAIAQEAGVGQGVLYRHFPARLDLAIAAFEDNFRDLEEAASGDDAGALGRVWDLLVAQTLREAAFVEMAVEARRTHPVYDGDTRLERLVGQTLPAARAAGLVDEATTVGDVLLAWRMVFGVVVTAATPEAAAADVARLEMPYVSRARGDVR